MLQKIVLAVVYCMLSVAALGQTFQQTKGFAFQGYARDFSGAALGSQEIYVRFSIYPSGGEVEYTEEQVVKTDAYGLFSATIGSVTPASFAALDFSQKDYWLRVETRANGGDWAAISETSLLAVPYAKSAENGLPVGTILPFGGPAANIPPGFLACDGAEVKQSDYPRLYNIIGSAWGAGSAGTFKVPDLRGYFLRGLDMGSGKDPDAAARTALNAGGNTGNNVGSYQDDDVKPHDHTVNDPGHSHSYTDTYNKGEDSDNADDRVVGSDDTTSRGGTTSSSRTNVTINNSTGKESRPKNAYVLFIIKY